MLNILNFPFLCQYVCLSCHCLPWFISISHFLSQYVSASVAIFYFCISLSFLSVSVAFFHLNLSQFSIFCFSLSKLTLSVSVSGAIFYLNLSQLPIFSVCLSFFCLCLFLTQLPFFSFVSISHFLSMSVSACLCLSCHFLF